MLAFPLIALAIALVTIGRSSSRLHLGERRRDHIARRVMLIVGVLLLIASLAFLFF